MNLSGLPLFKVISGKMSWLAARQTVIAENVANANTPNYTARDLKEARFDDLLRAGGSGGGTSRRGNDFGPLGARVSQPGHVAFSPTHGRVGAEEVRENGWGTSPSGNSVSLEEQMMKMSDTSMQYQTAASLYAKGLGLIRTALGRSQ